MLIKCEFQENARLDRMALQFVGYWHVLTTYHAEGLPQFKMGLLIRQMTWTQPN